MTVQLFGSAVTPQLLLGMTLVANSTFQCAATPTQMQTPTPTPTPTHTQAHPRPCATRMRPRAPAPTRACAHARLV